MNNKTTSALCLACLLPILSACSGDGMPSESQMKDAIETALKLQVRQHWNAEVQKTFSIEFKKFNASDCIKNGIEVSCNVDSEIVLNKGDKEIETMNSKSEPLVFQKSDGEWVFKP